MNRPLDPDALTREVCRYFCVRRWELVRKPGQWTQNQKVKRARAAFIHLLSDRNKEAVSDAGELLGYAPKSQTPHERKRWAKVMAREDLGFAAALQIIERNTLEAMEVGPGFDPARGRKARAGQGVTA